MKNSDVTPEQIADWKETHGEVHEILVAVKPVSFDPHIVADDDLEGEEHISAFIKPPSEKVLNYAVSLLARPIDAGSAILKSCWLGGDDRIRTDKAYLTAAAGVCLEFIEIRQARLKKR